jgi:K+ transporter
VPLFAFMLRNSVHASDRFNIPPKAFVELGRRVEI